MLTQFNDKPKTHGGLSCLQPDYLERFHSAIQMVNGAATLFMWSDEERVHWNLKREQLEKMQEELLLNLPRTPYKPSPLMQSITEKEYRHRWMKHQKAMLDKPESWQDFAGDKKSLAQCEEEWKKLSLTACWNHSQLLFIATQVLPALSAMQQESLKEMQKKRKKLPQAFYKSYRQYLRQLDSELKQLREGMVYGMLYRLRTFDRLNHSPNVVRHFIAKVQDAGAVLNGNLSRDKQMILDGDEAMSKEAFQAYHHLIERSEIKSAIKSLHSLSWFNEDAHIPVKKRGGPQGGLCKALHKPPYAKKNIMQSNLI